MNDEDAAAERRRAEDLRLAERYDRDVEVVRDRDDLQILENLEGEMWAALQEAQDAQQFILDEVHLMERASAEVVAALRERDPRMEANQLLLAVYTFRARCFNIAQQAGELGRVRVSVGAAAGRFQQRVFPGPVGRGRARELLRWLPPSPGRALPLIAPELDPRPMLEGEEDHLALRTYFRRAGPGPEMERYTFGEMLYHTRENILVYVVGQGPRTVQFVTASDQARPRRAHFATVVPVVGMDGNRRRGPYVSIAAGEVRV